MRPDIEKFFARYGAALSSDDVSGIVSCFDPPTVVVDDAATTLMIDHAHVEEYFTGMAERYRARGALSAADSRPAPELGPSRPRPSTPPSTAAQLNRGRR